MSSQPGCLAATVLLLGAAAWAEPSPGIGLLVKPGEMPALREKIKSPPWSEMYGRILKLADAAVDDWPKQREWLAPHLFGVWDLSVNNSADWPKDPRIRQTGLTMREFAWSNMCPAAFAYLVGGERKYAEAAWDILQHMGKVNRWGWFPWEGSNMPQIEAGMFARDAAFTLDFIWDFLTPEQRQAARDILAEKCVEPYYRLVLHSPCMGLHHLRSKNQGNNVLSGALIACLALGEDYGDADTWLRSFVQTFHWIVTHDIGWAGQHLESGMPGYWSISMQNLYTAATCLANVKGIDLRVHPGFMEATYYPIYHQSTVPSVGMFASPISPEPNASPGVIAGKPIELPHGASCGPWWYDYADRFPQSAAMYFINQAMVRKTPAGDLKFIINDCHQHGHSEIIALLWTKPSLHRPDAPAPKDLFKTTDRMTMIRSGYGLGRTYLYFNGDMFLSALNEVLCTTSGLSWHYKWHGFQKAESGIQTEGEPLAPSMVVRKSWHDEDFSFIHAVSGPSNITYYPPYGHDRSWRRYTRRDRDILYVRGEPGSDYFVFVDRVAQDAPRWHATLWQTWNHVYENKTANFARCTVEAPNRLRLERPNADLMLQFVAPAKVAFEQESAPGQPMVAYMYDHNLLTLRALAGGYGPAQGQKIEIPPTAWKGKGSVVRGAELGEGAPPAAYRVVGKGSLVGGGGESLNGFEADAKRQPGRRYRMAVQYRKTDACVYENICWQIDVELLDESGKVLASDRDLRDPTKVLPYDQPGQFRLADPRSMTLTTPWISTGWVYFDSPEGAQVAKVRGRLTAALWSHPPRGLTDKSVLEVGTLTIEPVGAVQRTKEETFVTIATPLKKGAPAPGVTSKPGEGQTWASLARGDGATDLIVVGAGRPVVFDGGSANASLALVRTSGGKVRAVCAQDATSIVVGGEQMLTSPSPVDLSARFDASGKPTWARISTPGPVELTFLRQSLKLQGGAYLAAPDGKLSPDSTAEVLTSNSAESRKLLKAGLEPLIRKIAAERDELTTKGMKNLALDAKVTASASRDERFGPQHVIDNQTWEYPADGLLDYTQGDLLTTPGGGYGTGATPLVGSDEAPMTSWPFYVRPTYWLLPYQKPGWVQLELKEESPVRIVRLLNTSNAGANDYATMKYRVELLDASGKVVAEKSGEFGKAFDRPFKAAFKIPEAFNRYGDTFKGMLEPGIKVPFGDGWQTVEFKDAPKARSVKVHVETYWALGGGLNEIQVY